MQRRNIYYSLFAAAVTCRLGLLGCYPEILIIFWTEYARATFKMYRTCTQHGKCNSLTFYFQHDTVLLRARNFRTETVRSSPDVWQNIPLAISEERALFTSIALVTS